MAEFDYQWKHTLKEEDLENEEDKFESSDFDLDEILKELEEEEMTEDEEV